MSRRKQNLMRPAVAAILYVVFAAYLYRPHCSGFTPGRWLLPIGVCVAAAGCFLLSRRWVVGFSGSFLAGLVYGFGPFVLSLARFHETAVLLAAGIPWLFMPAAYLGRKSGAVTALLSLLPFLAVVLFFRISAGEDYRLFAAPVQAAPKPADLFGFVAPLVMVTRTTALPGLYHAPVAALILGLAMVLRARRYGILLILVCGFALAFSRSFLAPAQLEWLGISPILWLSIPLVCLAVQAGIGLQGLIEASYSDGKWVLIAAIVPGVLAIATLLLAAEQFQAAFGLGDGYARLFVEAAKMYLVAAIAVVVVFTMTRQKLRLPRLRGLILYAVIGIDVFLSAQYIVDKTL
ncbi:MAG TPA: hypothetical protein PLU87_06515 [Sedimentisphaerales bacterium]|nr:hypothetical protein [Sedimentisphaerales bacterium]HRS10504.1 hypothetical protein [Sedimentisphaerales bacterium]HRV47272.1 hypothetical protein [Sedimentisphaerales bacterium]